MPIYEFICNDCGHQFEELLLSSSSSLDEIKCDECGSDSVAKLISASMFHGRSVSSDGGSCGPIPSGGFG